MFVQKLKLFCKKFFEKILKKLRLVVDSGQSAVI